MYETLYDGLIVNHSHNDYVEALAETGVIGGLFGALFLVVLFAEAWTRLKQANSPLDLALHIGALAACCGLLVHSLVDFNLHIPSNALIFLLQAALATSVAIPNRPDRPNRTLALQEGYRESGIAIPGS